MDAGKTPPAGLHISRRNLARMTALVGAATVAKATPAAAGPFHWLADLFGLGKHRGRQTQGLTTQSNSHCFLKGTAIRTMQGDKKIEDLTVGELLPTAFGGEVPIKSITRHRLGRAVRIARSALGPDMPNADLYVSSPHALLIDGTLVAAGNLLNGTTIMELLDFDDFESFNVVLEQHNVIYANGAPCETLLAPDEQPCVPRFAYGWRRGLVKSHLRSAVAPWIDRRQPVDIIRDGLDARGITLSQQLHL